MSTTTTAGPTGSAATTKLLSQVYNSKLDKTGISYTGEQLRQAVKREKKIDITLEQAYNFLRTHPTGEIASLQAETSHPRRFQTIGVTKAGVFFIDYGEFHKSWSKNNNGCTGFLVAVENLSNRLFVHPTRGKNTRQWLDSIARFIELTRDVKIIFSDRDSVATSPTFMKHVESKYGIRWKFLKKGNKSFLAERFVRYVKVKLSQALASASKSGFLKKRWIDYVEELCKVYNQQKIPGTSYKRGGVSDSNFDDFAGQLFKSKTVDLDRYNSFAAGPFQSEEWNKKAFKFQIGDKVLLLRKANWKNRNSGGGGGTSFVKPSLDGSYGSNEYTVSGRQLRADRSFQTLIPIYSLKEFGGDDHFHFYEDELVFRSRVKDASSTDRHNVPG